MTKKDLMEALKQFTDTDNMIAAIPGKGFSDIKGIFKIEDVGNKKENTHICFVLDREAEK